MVKRRNAYRNLVKNPLELELPGTLIWDDNIMMDLKETRVVGWELD
jgi:hypothetical protein